MPVWFWIVIGAAVLLLLGGKSGVKQEKGGSGKTYRIDRPHYMEEDESECSACGARFREKVMVCPRCGAVFAGARENQDEWFEEFMEYEDDEDE